MANWWRDSAQYQVFVKTLTGKTQTLLVSASTKVSCREYCIPKIESEYGGISNKMQERHNWDEPFAVEVVNQYAKFLELKVCMQDWKCTKLSATPLIEIARKEYLNDTRA